MEDSDEDDYSFFSIADFWGAGADEDPSKLKTDGEDDDFSYEETEDFSPLP